MFFEIHMYYDVFLFVAAPPFEKSSVFEHAWAVLGGRRRHLVEVVVVRCIGTLGLVTSRRAVLDVRVGSSDSDVAA